MLRNHYREWRRFWQYYKGKDYSSVRPLEEMKGDLFDLDDDYSLAHCVSTDLRMSRGIAVQFKRRYGRVTELKRQNRLPGRLAYLKEGNRYIYYLVTKLVYYAKPSYKNIWRALWHLRRHIVSHGVRRLGLPKIACGRDGKDWGIVKLMIEFMFRDVNCDILVVC